MDASLTSDKTLPAVIFLIGAGQSLFLTIALLSQYASQRAANRLLAAVTLLFALTLVDGFLDITEYYRDLPHGAADPRTI